MPKKKSKNLFAYDKILDLYENNLEAGRIYLYKMVPTLAINSPYHRYKSANHSTDDIHGEMFLFLDGILTSNRSRQSKFYYLWFTFHKMPDGLHKTLKLYKDVYTDGISLESTYYIDDIGGILEYLLDLHGVLDSVEKRVYRIISNGGGVSKVIKELHIQYKDAKDLYDTVNDKVNSFISKFDGNVADICES